MTTPPSAGATVRVRALLMSASGTAVLQATAQGLGFLTALLLARFLGAADYGIYTFSIAWATVLALFATIGIDRFLVRGIAVYEVKEQWRHMGGLLRRTTQLVLATSLAIAAGGCLVALMWLEPSLKTPFCIAMVLVPLMALTLLRQGAMQALGRVVTAQLPEYLIRPVLILVGVVALGVLAEDALTATTAMVVNASAVAVAFVVGTVLLMRALPAQLRSIEPSYATREWLQASIPMMLVAGAWTLNNYLGTLVAGTIAGSSAAGIYTIVQNTAAVAVLFMIAANMPLAPAIARLHARGERQRLERTTQRVGWAALLVSAPVCAVLAIFPDTFLGIFGDEFREGATALVIVALAQLVNAATGPAANVLVMTGHELAAARAVGIGALTNLGLAIALVPSLGVTGSAIAYASSLVLWNLAMVVIARRRLGINVTAFRSLSLAQGDAG